MHKFSLSIILTLLFVGSFFVARQDPISEVGTRFDYRNISYMVDDEEVRLVDGVAEKETAPGSATKTVTRYFGNEFNTDLDGDGRDDVVFLITQETGGNGVFFFVVAALNTVDGYRGSDGYLLGDRIAPQSIYQSTNPRHVRVIVANYADRALGEPMTAAPSVGKSVYLKLDTTQMRWGIVEANFEGESR